MISGTFRTALALAAACATAQPVRTGHAEAELLSGIAAEVPGDSASGQSGSSFWAALRLKPDPGWHVYWANPGDAGLAPQIAWSLPEGWIAGPLQFPRPARIENPPLASFGYKDEVWYPVRITVPAGAVPDDPPVLRARAEWLICADECLPESAELRASAGTVGGPGAARAAAWEERLARLPAPAPAWNWRAAYGDSMLTISWDAPPGEKPPGEVFFFPLDPGVLEHAAPQTLRREGGRLILAARRDPVIRARPDTLRGVLAFDADGSPGAAIALAIDARDSRAGGGSGTATALLLGLVALAAIILLAVLKRPHLNGGKK